MRRQVSLEQGVQAFVDAAKASTYYQLPGSVLSYDPVTQTATVQPMLNDPRVDVETGAIVFEPWKPIPNVPIEWPRFGGSPGFVVAGFLSENDQVVLRAFDLDITPWRAQGRSQNPVNPFDVRRQGGNYWSAVPTDLTGPMTDSDVTSGSSYVIGSLGGVKCVWNSLGLVIAAGTPLQGCARVGDTVAGMFAITSGSTKVFVGG